MNSGICATNTFFIGKPYSIDNYEIKDVSTLDYLLL